MLPVSPLSAMSYRLSFASTSKSTQAHPILAGDTVQFSGHKPYLPADAAINENSDEARLQNASLFSISDINDAKFLLNQGLTVV